MGWYLFENEPTSHGRFCCDCGFFQVWENFPYLAHGRNGRLSRCRVCNNEQRRWLYRYRRDHVAPKHCEGCSKAKYLEVDHDHDAHIPIFRRWLCRSCNRLDRRWYRRWLVVNPIRGKSKAVDMRSITMRTYWRMNKWHPRTLINGDYVSQLQTKRGEDMCYFRWKW